jgi:hypothetical protein
MGSPQTALKAARIFVFLAQKAGMSLSQEIIEELAISEEKKKETAKPKAEKIKLAAGIHGSPID